MINSRLWVLKNIALYSMNINARNISSIRYPRKQAITCPNFYSLSRQFSESTNVENMVADFERVKKATSQEAVYIIDVREPEEIKEHGKIPNSINIPLGNVSSLLSNMPEEEFKKKFNRPKPTEDTEMIFYCMIGKRSGMAQQNALNLGYKNARNYLGSWTEWASKNQETKC